MNDDVTLVTNVIIILLYVGINVFATLIAIDSDTVLKRYASFANDKDVEMVMLSILVKCENKSTVVVNERGFVMLLDTSLIKLIVVDIDIVSACNLEYMDC